MKSSMKTHIELPSAALSVMTLLEDKGFEVYLIGGYVRDLLIGRKSTDLDMATNAPTSAMIKIFKEYPLSLIGEKLGTVGVKIDSTWVEITTYRSETTSSNYRHPDEVRFIGSLKDDVLRRDFTINALALNVYGDLIDYTEGQLDLQRKQIRAIGHAEERFEEDALRILRALRFSAQLGFSIQRETEKAMLSHMGLIQTLPIERIAAELDKLIMGHHAGQVLQQYPLLIKPWLDYDIRHADQVNLFTDKALRYLCLLDHLDEQAIQHQLETLKCAKAFTRKVLDLKTLSVLKTSDRFELKVLMGRYGIPLIDMALSYQSAKSLTGIDPLLFAALKAEKSAVTLKALALDGDDLLALGYSGKKISMILTALLELVMREKVSNDKASLIKALKGLP